MAPVFPSFEYARHSQRKYFIFVCIVLVMRFRDFGFYISEPANLHAVKSGAIAARISPFILLSNAHFQTYSRYDKVAKSSPRNVSPNRFGT